MRRLIVYSGFLSIILFQACAPKKPVYKAPTTTATKSYEPPVQKEPYVPFTRELFDKLNSNKIDVKLVQYYIDQQLVLTRYLENDQLSVKNGIIKFNNGKYVNEVVIPQYTPVVCDAVEGDGLRVSGETGSNSFKFLNSKQYSPVNYIFNPDKWNKDGTCEVIYDNNKYVVTCPTCSSNTPNEAKLVVKQSALDDLSKQTKILKGRTINSNSSNGPGY